VLVFGLNEADPTYLEALAGGKRKTADQAQMLLHIFEQRALEDDAALVEASKNKAQVVRGSKELDGKKDGTQKRATINRKLSKLMATLVACLNATDDRKRLAATRTLVESGARAARKRPRGGP
jgi:hypothetical protein